MSLGSDTAALLTQALHALNHHISLPQYALHSHDDHVHILAQISATVDVAAKLAEVAHLEALTTHHAGGRVGNDETERIRAETERLRAEAARFAKFAERLMKEGEKMRVEMEMQKLCKE